MPGYNEGTQIRTWIPDDQYSIIREFAAARQVSISQIVRELIATGFQNDAQQQAAKDALKSVTSSLDHLERLIFFIAQNASYTAVSGEKSGEAAAVKLYPHNPEQAAEAIQIARGEIMGIVHERIRKALRGPKPKLEGED